MNSDVSEHLMLHKYILLVSEFSKKFNFLKKFTYSNKYKIKNYYPK